MINSKICWCSGSLLHDCLWVLVLHQWCIPFNKENHKDSIQSNTGRNPFQDKPTWTPPTKLDKGERWRTVRDFLVKSHGFPSKNHGFPSKNHGFPSKNHGFPSKNHGFPSKNHGFPSKNHGFPSKNHGFPSKNHGFPSKKLWFPE